MIVCKPLLISVDELNAHLGVIKNFCPDITLTLEAVQVKLMNVMNISEADVNEIKASKNCVDGKYPFEGETLPGQCKTSSFLDLAAAVCRRAEHEAIIAESNGAPIRGAVHYLSYLNFLLQAMSRGVAKERK